MRHFGFFIRIKGSDGTRPKVKKSSNVGFQFGCIGRGRITRPTPTHRKRLKGIEIEIPKHESQGHLFTAAVFSKVLLNLSCLLLLSRKVATPFLLKPTKVFCCFCKILSEIRVFSSQSSLEKIFCPREVIQLPRKQDWMVMRALHCTRGLEVRESVCVLDRERERERAFIWLQT